MPNRLWLGDITYAATQEGWLYLTVLLDAHSRWVVGWAMADHLRTELAAGALTMAESFFATLKAEIANTQVWPTRAATRLASFEWLEVWYNRQRRHSALGYHAPVIFEENLLSCRAA